MLARTLRQLPCVMLLAVLAVVPHSAFGQAAPSAEGVEQATQTPRQGAHSVPASASSGFCVASAHADGNTRGLAAQAPSTSPWIGLPGRTVLPPECLLALGYTDSQEKRWNQCRSNLRCSGGSYFMCANNRGDQFASCRKSYCSDRRVQRVPIDNTTAHRELPECILPAERNEQQRDAWSTCKTHLRCRKTFSYICTDDAGNMFATCRKSLCSARKVNRHMAGSH